MMKHNMKYMFSLMFVLLFAQGAWADETATGQTVTIIKQLNGSADTTTSPGEVSHNVSNGKCTLTVTPASGNKITKEYITAYSVVTGNVAQAPRRSPNIDNTPIEVKDAGDNTDPSAVTYYEFTMPDDGSDVEVTVNFQPVLMYDLLIGGTQVTEINLADVLKDGKVSFAPASDANGNVNTLTLNGAVFSATTSAPIIVSGLDGLTVNVVGAVAFNFNDVEPAYVFQSTNANAVLTFTTTDEGNASVSIPRGIQAGAFSGFKNVVYMNGLVLGTVEGDVPSYTIAPVEAPVFGDFYFDDTTGKYIGAIGTACNYDGATIKYAITYADGVHQNVPETSYEESVSMEGPGTLTAYVVVGGNQGPEATAKLFGFTQHEIADTLGNPAVAIPTLVPAIQQTDGLTVSYLSNEGIASVSNGTIIKGGKVGTTDISAILNTGNAEPPFAVLNDNYEGGYRVDGLTVTVMPVAPSASLEGGSYSEKQYVTLTSNLQDGVSGFIHYKRIVNGVEKVDSTYSVPLTIDETTTLTFYQEAFDDEGAPFFSETKSVTYVILQEPDYHFSDSESGESYYSSGSTVYNLYFGIENTMPWLINVPEGMAITYASEDENVATIDQTGLITLTGAGHVWITASNEATDVYKAHTERIRLEITPPGPQISLADGIYYTGQKVTLTPTVPNGSIYYTIGYDGNLMAYTNGEEIELPVGCYGFYPTTRCVTKADNSDTDYMESGSNYRGNYYVFNEPVISKNSGTYDGPLEVEITGLPEDDYYQILTYYYFDDDEEHATLYNAGEKITVTASKKLKVYLFVEGDSGRKYKSEVIEREYTIRQNAGLAYLQNGEQAEAAVYTIGGTDNQELPTLQNENKLAITYSSSNTAVATINDEGEVTIVGMGETTITATSAQTEALSAGEASYPLTVLKDLSYESITVTVADATYNMGEDVEPEVTVMDGDTDITEYVMVEYANNTQVGSQATVTITPSDDLDVNYYVGSTSATFTINNRTLTVGEDMAFANGQTWATYYNTDESLNLPEGLAAYVVTSIEGNTLNLRALSYVPKNVPVLLNQTSETVVGNSDFDNNELIGTAQATDVSSINNGTVYVLYNGMFVKSASGTIPANRAYLVLSTANNGSDAPAFLLFNIESTGMHMVLSNPDAQGSWYDLNGRKLSAKPTAKGLYIHNGKKKVVK